MIVSVFFFGNAFGQGQAPTFSALSPAPSPVSPEVLFLVFSPLFLLREAQTHEQILSGGSNPTAGIFSIIPVRSVFHHPRSFIFSLPLLLSAGPLTNPLGSVPSRILWEVSSREFFGKSPLTNPLRNPLSRTLWEISSHGSFGKRPLTNPLEHGRFSIHFITTPAMEWFSLFL